MRIDDIALVNYNNIKMKTYSKLQQNTNSTVLPSWFCNIVDTLEKVFAAFGRTARKLLSILTIYGWHLDHISKAVIYNSKWPIPIMNTKLWLKTKSNKRFNKAKGRHKIIYKPFLLSDNEQICKKKEVDRHLGAFSSFTKRNFCRSFIEVQSNYFAFLNKPAVRRNQRYSLKCKKKIKIIISTY